MHTVLRRKAAGQSIPLIALMIVVLFGMVGLAVDVGNTYAEQRTVVRASNAASIAAIDAVIKGYDDPGVAKIINESLKTNGLHLQATSGVGDSATTTGDRLVRAYYMDVEGRPISNCLIGNCGRVPSNVNYIEVNVDGLVGTYFARVVGQSTLPVHAKSFAGRCPPTNGVYPLAVQNGDVGTSGFTKPLNTTDSSGNPIWGNNYRDSNYPTGLTWRRIFLKANAGAAGNFSFLRWLSDPNSGNATATAAAFAGDGTLAVGFNEAPWPANGDPKPANYPLAPGQITVNDWVYGDSGLSWSNAPGDSLRDNLESLMTKHTLLLLPMVDASSGAGSNSQFKMARLGSFYIVDPFPSDPNNGGVSKQGGGNAYIDLAYVGSANESPCLVTNVDPDTKGTSLTPTDNSFDVRFPFSVNPRWAGTDKPNEPVAFQLVLDVSGSMSWDFNGSGTLNATQHPTADSSGGINVHCEWSNPDTTYAYNDTCTGGPNSSWRTVQERRIYLTKVAVDNFITNMGPNDTMRFTSFSTDGIKTVPTTGWSADRALLRAELKTIGASPSDYPYRTSGGTPGPQAMNKAKSIILAAPSTAPNGQSYRRVVVYLTDGVANVFLDGSGNSARDNCGDRTVNAARNTADPCQIGTTASGQLRPITAMIDQANQLKRADTSVQLYVIALAGVATDGLLQVASSPSMMYPVNNPAAVTSILETIRNKAAGSTCLRQGGAAFTDVIQPSNQSQLGAPWALASGVYGKATIYDQGGTPVATVDITHDPISGKLGAQFNLPPGNYQLGAWIGYKGPDNPNPTSRVYNSLSDNATNFANRLPFSIVANQSLNTTYVEPMTYVDLAPTVDVCSGR